MVTLLRLFWGFVVAMTSLGAPLANAQALAITNGVLYLQSTQSSDGSWGSISTSSSGIVPTTALVVETLHLLEASPSPQQIAGREFLATQSLDETELLARRILALLGTGSSVPSDADRLLGTQNLITLASFSSDGGWGGAGMFGSTILDTSLATVALAGAGATGSPSLLSASGYLLAVQNEDGGWGLASGKASRVYDSSWAVRAMDALSAVEALSIANGTGLRTYNVTVTNAPAIVPGLSVSNAIKTDIMNAVAAGKHVTIPEQEITIGGWSGTGYIVTDPATGSGAYMISGGFSGAANTTCEGGPVPTAVAAGSDPDIVGACALKIVDAWKKTELNLGKIAIIAAFVTTISLLFLYAVPAVWAAFPVLSLAVPAFIVLVTLAIVITFLMYGLYLAILNLVIARRKLLKGTIGSAVDQGSPSLVLVMGPYRGDG